MYDDIQEREAGDDFDGLDVREVLSGEALPCRGGRGGAHKRILQIPIDVNGVRGAFLEVGSDRLKEDVRAEPLVGSQDGEDGGERLLYDDAERGIEVGLEVCGIRIW